MQRGCTSHAQSLLLAYFIFGDVSEEICALNKNLCGKPQPAHTLSVALEVTEEVMSGRNRAAAE